jgi:hypothetical protein
MLGAPDLEQHRGWDVAESLARGGGREMEWGTLWGAELDLGSFFVLRLREL